MRGIWRYFQLGRVIKKMNQITVNQCLTQSSTVEEQWFGSFFLGWDLIESTFRDDATTNSCIIKVGPFIKLIQLQGQLNFQVDDTNVLVFFKLDPYTYLFNDAGVSSSSRMRNLLFCLFSLISRRAICNDAGETGRAWPIKCKVWQNEKIYFFESLFHWDQGFFVLDAVL